MAKYHPEICYGKFSLFARVEGVVILLAIISLRQVGVMTTPLNPRKSVRFHAVCRLGMTAMIFE